MKKITFFFIIIIAFLGMIWYIYEEAKIVENKRIGLNNEYEQILNKEINGSDITSIINKVAHSNEINNVEKDKNGIYIDNNNNSINIEIKFIDNDKNIKFEKLYVNRYAKVFRIV